MKRSEVAGTALMVVGLALILEGSPSTVARAVGIMLIVYGLPLITEPDEE